MFGARVGEVASAVLLPVDGVGMLAVGSQDANRFHPGMGTVFLKLIAEAVAAAVARFAPDKMKTRQTMSAALAAPVDAFLGYLRVERRYSPSTIEHYGRALAALVGYAEARKLAHWRDLRPDQVQASARRRTSARARTGIAARARVGVAEFFPLPRARRRGRDQSGDRRALAARASASCPRCSTPTR